MLVITARVRSTTGRYCFQFVCQFTPGGGGTQSQVQVGGVPGPGPGRGVLCPGLGGGYPVSGPGRGGPRSRSG